MPASTRLLKDHAAFLLILLTCAVLRFIPLFSYQFTYDELSALDRTQFASLSELFEKGIRIDAHPALVQLYMYAMVKAFGFTEWIIKLPFLIMSLLAVIYIYRTGLEFFGKLSALAAAALSTFSLIFVFHAPIARMYINGVFFTAAMIFHLFRLAAGTRSRRDLALLGLFALLSALSHHINALYAFTLVLYGFFLVPVTIRKAYLLMCVAVLALYAPHLPVTLNQLGLAGIGPEQGGWLTPPGSGAFFDLLKVLFGTGWVPWIIVAGLVVTAVVDGIRMNRYQVALLVLFFLNFLIVYLYAVLRAPIYQHSVMLFAGTGFILFVTSLLRFRNSAFRAVFVAVLSLALLFRTYIQKEYYAQCVKAVYEHQYERTAALANEQGRDSVQAVFMECDRIMQHIYAGRYGDPHAVRGDSLAAHGGLARFVAGVRAPFLVLTSATPAQQAVVRQYFPWLMENIQTQSVNLKIFSKRNPAAQADEDESLLVAIPAAPGPFAFRRKDLPIDAGQNEFPFEAAASYSNVAAREGNVILVSARMRGAADLTEACISVKDGDSTVGYNSAAARDFVKRGDTVVVFAEHYCGTDHKRLLKNGRVSCYLWNREKLPFVLENFSVTVVDYRPRRWQFWD